MNTLQLIHALKGNVSCATKTVHVGPAESIELFMSQRSPKSGIFNLSPSYDGPGTHWVAVFTTDGYKYEIFDSYGQSVLMYSHHFDKLKKVRYTENLRSIQSFNSSICGEYCIFFLVKRSHGETFCKILSYFGRDKTRNDCVVKVFFYACILEKGSVNDYCKLVQCCRRRCNSR
jgi:hypothetical protein